MAKPSAVEWDIIEARVQQAVETNRLRNASLGFLYLVLEQFLPGRESEFSEIVTDGSNDRGIDAIDIVTRDGDAEITLFQAKYRDTIKTADKTINDAEILKIIAFLHELFSKSEELLKTGNLQLTEAVQRIWSLHKSGVVCRYKVILCSNDRGLSPSARKLFDSGLASLPNVTYECYCTADLIRDIGSDGRQREDGSIVVIGREIFERADGDIRGVIASVDAKSFVELIQTDDKKSVKRHLFDDNLRVYLGANGGYNSEIIATATSDDSHLFWYLNNGITITCRNYSFNKGHLSPTLKMSDFQIVNGAQTSHSLLEASRRSPRAIENVVLTVRVYATDRGDIAERVAVATNSQARIQSRDLRANHSALKKMEIAFSDRGYYFERKRNMHAGRDPRKRLDALKLGQIIVSYYLREPDRAKADSDSIFGERFGAIFHEHYDMTELCRLVEFFGVIEEKRDTYIARHGESTDAGGDHQFLVYGQWFVLYAACLLLGRRNKRVPKSDEFDQLAEDAIGVVARSCGGVRTSQYQMFRSPKTRDRILAELSGKQMSLFDLLASLPEVSNF